MTEPPCRAAAAHCPGRGRLLPVRPVAVRICLLWRARRMEVARARSPSGESAEEDRVAERLDVDTDRLRALAQSFEEDSQAALGNVGRLRGIALEPSGLPWSGEFAAAQAKVGETFPIWASDYCGSVVFVAQGVRVLSQNLEDVEWDAAATIKLQITGEVGAAFEELPTKDDRKVLQLGEAYHEGDV